VAATTTVTGPSSLKAGQKLYFCVWKKAKMNDYYDMQLNWKTNELTSTEALNDERQN